jgi:hypothetical protein
MPSRMYSTIQLLEIMRRSAFKSPLSYPSLLDCGSGTAIVQYTRVVKDVLTLVNLILTILSSK